MILSQVQKKLPHMNFVLAYGQKRSLALNKNILLQSIRTGEVFSNVRPKTSEEMPPNDHNAESIYMATARVIELNIQPNKDPVVLSFDEVPGPKSLKYISTARNYLSEIGTQITTGILTLGLNIGSYVNTRKPLGSLSTLFDEYGPVVRFVSPLGADIVLINHPDHIQKVYSVEGEYPVRSTLDCLEKYRKVQRQHTFGGLFSTHGVEWSRQRNVVCNPLQNTVSTHLSGVNNVCENFVQKVYNNRNYQDEVTTDLMTDIHKWAFDSMGLVLFSKQFCMLDTDLVSSQCDMSWLYHSLEKATNAIAKCESGMQLWKIFTTPAWSNLVKYCDCLDNLIGKHVLEAEQALSYRSKDDLQQENTLINAMLLSNEKMSVEDIATVIMDMLLIGVNTISSSTAFLLYNLAKHQKAQKILSKEIQSVFPDTTITNYNDITKKTPYLQACIKETLRLVPPIPVLTRILPKNVTLDRYNIPKGTLIIMSAREASLKESNYDNARAFHPERWLTADAQDYHAFASIPFGFGSRKCVGQDISETMMSLIAIRILQKFKLEYLYGDIEPQRSFIAKPNRPLKLRFLDKL